MNKKLKLGLIAATVAIAVLAVVFLQQEKHGADGGHNEAGHSEEKEHKEHKDHKEGESQGAGETEAHGHNEKEAHGGHAENAAKGAHGGALLSDGDHSIEVLLEEGKDGARLSVYPMHDGKLLAPQAGRLTATLTRPLQAPQQIALEVSKDAYRSSGFIDEPHLFDIRFELAADGKTSTFSFSREEGKIALSAEQIKDAGIAIKTAAAASLNSSLQLPGEIRLNEDRTAHIVPQVAGVVESVQANLGQMVKKGQLLAVINSGAVSDLRSEYQNARKRLALAQSGYAREKKLWEEKISAEQDYLQASQARHEAEIAVSNAQHKLRALGAGGAADNAASLSRYEVRAPFDGLVVEKHMSIGEPVKEGANLFVVSDLSSVWAEIVVTPKDMNAVKVGEQAVVKATAFESAAHGKISYVGALLGEQTRSAKAHVVLPNPGNVWRPGLFVNVEVIADQREAAVSVAAEAIQTVDGKSIVFVEIPGGFMAQEVATGRSDGKLIEIRDGLKAGTRYAAAGSFAIKAELGKGSAEHSH
jgi:cobalt-zinc-cadmium efflux system membrane fusion protein